MAGRNNTPRKFVTAVNRNRMPTKAANDNVKFVTAADALRDRYVQKALRVFAEKGLTAASHAFAMSEKSRMEGKLAAAEEWLQICRILDRRLALKLQSAQKLKKSA